ncbi:hypothetical protein FOMPIDRAFT_48847 [Fomitopsis schrenkii]|uniref:Cytochrome P450 n=1 Tax=Fomitopsis schrenkii TaxID=2126942 RepID=S8F4S6_FOMSC|nr:hypothetical protein FOMPIDRAFT_48847 [Fomitopsis schrenkii]
MYLRLAEFALLVLVCRLFFIRHKSRGLRLPPGPPGLPLIGNLHQISDDYQQDTFSEWGRRYGDVVYARFVANDVLIVNSAAAARVLMEKRGAKYSGRPLFTNIFLCTYYSSGGFSWNLAFMPNTDRWKRHRKWFQHGFQVKRRLDEYIPIQQRETRRILSDLLVEPDAYMSHIKRFAAATMLEIGYGHTVTSLDDDYIHMIDSALDGMFLAGNPGSMMVDFFPPLKYVPAWLPGLTWKKTATRLRPVVDVMNLSPFRAVVKAMNEGSAKSSFASAILDEVSPDEPLSPAEEREMSGAVGTVYAAGTETTVSMLSAWLLAMVRYPEVYKRAQTEINMVIGTGRLPELHDRDSLPFLECILKEVYRWHCPVPLGVPHALSENDEYRGWWIPKGSMVIANLWGMMRDPELYPDPEAFRPERFLGFDKEAEVLDPKKVVFGFGRRVCPGQFLADNNVWLVLATLIATMNIRKARGEDGVEITPRLDYTSGIVSHPKPFPCDILPRSEKARQLILDSCVDL